MSAPRNPPACDFDHLGKSVEVPTVSNVAPPRIRPRSRLGR
jgi:hypothetical protein